MDSISSRSKLIITGDTTEHMDQIVKTIKDFGVTFQVKVTFRVWASKTKKDDMEWTSLRGADKKKLLCRLPNYIPQIFQNNGK